MAGELDQISRLIGGLEAKLDIATAEIAKLRGSVHDINGKLTVAYGNDERIDVVEHRVTALERARWTAQGFAAGAGAVAGAVGGMIMLALSKMWPGGGH